MSEATAEDVVALLEHKHARDIFVSECKFGPTLSGLCTGRLDGWALKRSWKHPRAIGYEVKVARSDFLGDEKWRNYLSYCNEFYFVAPPGVISRDEVPADAGLLVTSVNCKRLYTKKKAPWSEAPDIADVFRYVLFSRAGILSAEYEFDNAAYWRKWLAQRDEKKELGWNVSQKIRELVDTRIRTVKRENANLRAKIEKLSEVEKWLADAGITELGYSYLLQRQIAAAIAALPAGFKAAIDEAYKKLATLRERLEALQDDEEQTK